MKKQKKQTGRANYFRALAGFYLAYLAYQLLSAVVRGKADSVVLNAAGGVAFALVGGWLLWEEWKSYQYAKAHKDDPESWSDEPFEPEELEEPEESAEDSDDRKEEL